MEKGRALNDNKHISTGSVVGDLVALRNSEKHADRILTQELIPKENGISMQ